MVVSKKPIPRRDILQSMRNNITQGIPIIGCGAGVGLSAKCEEAGGADFIVCYNTGRFRMQGRASVSGAFPYANANDMIVALGYEVLPLVKHTPVIAGVFAHDSYRFIDLFLEDLRRMGYSGIVNFPCTGCFNDSFLAELENVGYAFQNEVELIKLAHDMDFLTAPYVYNETHVEKMLEAGADVLCIHCGGTNGGMIGVGDDVAQTLEQAVQNCQNLADYAKSIRKDVIVCAHGGPLSTPADVEYLLKNTTDIDGFVGASSAERIPTEIAITECIRGYKAVRYR